MTLRYLTAGESHGETLVTILTGLPAGVPVSLDFINRDLWRRQQGYGRGGRMKIETDKAHIVSGVRHSKTTFLALSSSWITSPVIWAAVSPPATESLMSIVRISTRPEQPLVRAAKTEHAACVCVRMRGRPRVAATASSRAYSAPWCVLPQPAGASIVTRASGERNASRTS